jgi:hypothetical protein
MAIGTFSNMLILNFAVVGNALVFESACRAHPGGPLLVKYQFAAGNA